MTANKTMEMINKGYTVIRLADTNTGWIDENADHEDYGQVVGYIRGYNVEFVDESGNLVYGTTEFTDVDLEKRHAYELEAYGVIISHDMMNTFAKREPTGRVVFRGYYIEEYDPKEHETYVYPASEEVDEIISNIRKVFEKKEVD